MQKSEAETALETGKFYGRDGNEDRERLRREINGINAIFGDKAEVEDDLIDKWERELEQGITPDLDE